MKAKAFSFFSIIIAIIKVIRCKKSQIVSWPAAIYISVIYMKPEKIDPVRVWWLV